MPFFGNFQKINIFRSIILPNSIPSNSWNRWGKKLWSGSGQSCTFSVKTYLSSLWKKDKWTSQYIWKIRIWNFCRLTVWPVRSFTSPVLPRPRSDVHCRSAGMVGCRPLAWEPLRAGGAVKVRGNCLWRGELMARGRTHLTNYSGLPEEIIYRPAGKGWYLVWIFSRVEVILGTFPNHKRFMRHIL